VKPGRAEPLETAHMGHDTAKHNLLMQSLENDITACPTCLCYSLNGWGWCALRLWPRRVSQHILKEHVRFGNPASSRRPSGCHHGWVSPLACNFTHCSNRCPARHNSMCQLAMVPRPFVCFVTHPHRHKRIAASLGPIARQGLFCKYKSCR